MVLLFMKEEIIVYFLGFEIKFSIKRRKYYDIIDVNGNIIGVCDNDSSQSILKDKRVRELRKISRFEFLRKYKQFTN